MLPLWSGSDTKRSRMAYSLLVGFVALIIFYNGFLFPVLPVIQL